MRMLPTIAVTMPMKDDQFRASSLGSWPWPGWGSSKIGVGLADADEDQDGSAGNALVARYMAPNAQAKSRRRLVFGVASTILLSSPSECTNTNLVKATVGSSAQANLRRALASGGAKGFEGTESGSCKESVSALFRR